MAMNELDGILAVLQNADQEIFVDPALAERAKLPLDRMLNFSAQLKR
jgi:quinolinate synthase